MSKYGKASLVSLGSLYTISGIQIVKIVGSNLKFHKNRFIRSK